MAKIVSMTPKGQWQEFYKIEVRFDNGDFGTAFAKSQTPSYAVGDEVDYSKNEKGTSQNSTRQDLVEVTEAALPIPRKYRVTNAPLPSSVKLP
jgi:hypothetical protein